MRAFTAVILGSVVLSLASCTPSSSDVDTSQSDASPAPLRQLNPAPRQGYRIRLTIQDAPGPLVLTDATAQYDVVNEVQCGEGSPYGGVYRMTSNEVLTVARLDDVTYEGIVHFDQILDEDYYGNGVCMWELTGVRAAMSATGSARETRFSPGISADSIKINGSETTYFWRGMYPTSDVEGYSDSGQVDRSRINRGDDELFTMELSAKEIRP